MGRLMRTGGVEGEERDVWVIRREGPHASVRTVDVALEELLMRDRIVLVVKWLESLARR